MKGSCQSRIAAIARRGRALGIAAMSLALGAVGALRAQIAGTIDTGFNPTFTPRADSSWPVVQAFAVQPDGKMFVAGSFATVNGYAIDSVARLNDDGSVDTTFNSPAGFMPGSIGVYALAVQLDGKVFVAGENYIIRLNADGSRDSSWSVTPNGGVMSVAVQADGKILIGGFFTSVNGHACNRLARLNPDGTLDPFFANVGTGPNAYVYVVAVQADRKIVIGGGFSTVDSQPRSGVARLESDGLVESIATFNVGTGANSDVGRVAIQPDGKILLTGSFTSIDSQPRSRIARLNANGSVDSTFNPGTGVSSAVNCLAVQANGQLLIGGNFLQVNGQPRKFIARLDPGGSVQELTSFADALPGVWEVWGMAQQSDGRILIGGRGMLRLLNDQASQTLTAPEPSHVYWQRGGAAPEVGQVTIALSTDGGGSWTTLGNATWNGSAWQYSTAGLPGDGLLRARGRTGGGTGCVEQVAAFGYGGLDTFFDPNVPTDNPLLMALQANGKIVIGGSFDHAGGEPRRYVAQLNSDGSVDSSFDPGTALAGHPAAVAVQTDGKVVLGGGTRLSTDGSVDPSYAASVAAEHLAIQADGRIIVAPPHSNVARLNTDGSLDSTFVVTGIGTYPVDNVHAVAVQGDGRILVAGRFSQVNGQTRNCIVRLNTDGSLDGTFDPGSGPTHWIYAICAQPDGKVLVGGTFTSFNGQALQNLARLNSDGTVDPTFHPGTGPSADVLSIDLQVDGDILIGGYFMSVNGQPRGRMARLHADGSLDPAFFSGAGATSAIREVLLQADGKVLVTGYFDHVNGITRNSVARILNGPVTQSLSATSATRLLWLRSGTAPEAGQVTFEQSSDGGATWSLLGAGGRVTGGWEFNGPLADASLLRARARTAGGTSLVEQTAAFDLDMFVTQPPTLNTPATGTASTNPVAVSFSLPEAALADSLRLVFDSGGTRILILANSQGTQGTHSFSFDPANPTASPEIASGPALPDGTYNVALYYADALGNPSARSEWVTEFRIDTQTIPPSLTAPTAGTISKSPVAVAFSLPESAASGGVALIFYDGVITRTLVLAESQRWAGSHSFGLPLANPTSAPEIFSGPAIPDGIYTVTLSYSDGLGNAAASAPPAGTVTIDTLAPLLSLPAPITAEATSAAGATVTFSVTATDALDPLPVVAAVPVSGSIFHLGVTHVNASASDAAGNVAIGSFDVTIVDTTPPTIAAPVGGFEPASLVAGAGEHATLADYTSQAVTSDNVGVTSVTQSPVAGASVELGTSTITLTAHDAAGHIATVNFDVNAQSGLAATTTIATSGQDIPGAGSGGIPSGAKWAKFGVPVLNDAGQVAFLATWTSPLGTGKGIFRASGPTLELVAAIGDVLPSGPSIRSLNDPLLGEGGEITVRAALRGSGVSSGSDSAILNISAPGTAAIVVREGEIAPGTGGAKFAAFTSLSRCDEETLFCAKLRLGTGTPSTALTSDRGLWSHTATWGNELRLREGQTLTTSAGPKRLKAFKGLAAMSGTPGVGRSQAYDNVAMVHGSFSDRTTGLISLDHAAGPAVEASSGDVVNTGLPGLTWTSFSVPAAGIDQGFCAVLGTVNDNGTSARAIFAGDVTGQLEAARVGGDAGGGIQFRALKDPIYRCHGSDYSIAFPATLAGPGVTAANNAALYAGPVGTVERLARTGEAAPEAAGTNYRAFKALAIFGNARASAVWVAQLRGPAVRTTNDRAVWAQNSAGAPHLLLREGDQLGGKKVKAFTVLSSVAGSPDVTRSVNALRSAVVRVNFTDRTQALVKYDLP